MTSQETLFARGNLSSWLEQRIRNAVDEVRQAGADEVLARPYEQLAEEVIQRYLIQEPRLDEAGITGGVTDERIDVSHDIMRAVLNRSTPTYISGSRITFRVPFTGLPEILQLQASKFGGNPPRASVADGYLIVFRDVPADVIVNRPGFVGGSDSPRG